MEKQLRKKMGMHTVQIGDWIIWNARSSSFEKLRGITLSQLISLKTNESNLTFQSYIANAFSFLSADGKSIRELPIERMQKFVDKFSNEFYPGRYALKDCLYEQVRNFQFFLQLFQYICNSDSKFWIYWSPLL